MRQSGRTASLSLSNALIPRCSNYVKGSPSVLLTASWGKNTGAGGCAFCLMRAKFHRSCLPVQAGELRAFAASIRRASKRSVGESPRSS